MEIVCDALRLLFSSIHIRGPGTLHSDVLLLIYGFYLGYGGFVWCYGCAGEQRLV